MEIRDILEDVRSGKMTAAAAEKLLQKEAYVDLGYAKIDVNRERRCGLPEVVFCSRKEQTFLQDIYRRILAEKGEVFGTRATEEQYRAVQLVIPDIAYDNISHILKYEQQNKKRVGKVCVCTAGTADIGIAEEAAQTAEFLGCNTERLYDVGVSGLHRLLDKLELLQDANCIIAVAGMEGALAGVIGGLVAVPVIAVPTSVGYGASFNGVAALLTMLNSCANCVSVVNIDNGYGAGVIASQINRLSVNGGRASHE